MEFKYAVFAFAFVFLLFLLVKEVKRENRSNIYLRLIASILAVTSFVLLIVPISYRSMQKESINEVTLLTNGYHADSISKLPGKKYTLVYNRSSLDGINRITDFSYFLTTNPELNKFKVYGYGLDRNELKSLTNKIIEFHPSPDPTGVIYCNWNKKLGASTPLIIQGRYQNSTKTSVKLLLKGFGIALDSTTIIGNSVINFSFSNQPKQVGKAVYELISLQQNDTLSVEPVAFEVTPIPKMRVLILASSPDFEYKFLKNWLYENRYPVAFRGQISKDKFSSDFLNLDRFNISQLTKKALQNFDVLIIDEEELSLISLSEKALINEAVVNGLGVFLRLSPTKDSKTGIGKVERYEIPETQEKTLQLKLSDDQFKFSPLPTTAPSALRPTRDSRILITDLKGRVFVKSNMKGEGKLMISTLLSTYNWMLSGKKKEFQLFWSTVLKNVARKKQTGNSFTFSPQFPTEYEKTNFVIEQTANLPQVSFGNNLLSVKQNMALPFKWEASVWATKTGWNSVAVDNEINNFYVYENTSWQAYKNYQKLKLTNGFVKKSKTDSDNSELGNEIVEKQLSVWLFFIGFLISIGFLWYESRILANR